MDEQEFLILREKNQKLRRELRYLKDTAGGVTVCVQLDKVLEVLATLRLSRDEFERIRAIVENGAL